MAPKKRASPPSIDDLVDTEPGRIEAIWREVRKPLLWTTLAFIAIAAVVFVGTTDRGEERLAALPAAVGTLLGRGEPVSAREIARVSDEIVRLRDEARRSGSQRLAVEQRLADLERGLGDVTGTIRRSEITGSIARPAGEPASPPPEPAPDMNVPVPPARPEAAPTGGVTLASRSQFGIDLGPEATLGALRTRWQRLAQRHGPTLANLEPVVAVREGNAGQPVLHVIAGPIADVSNAAALCARLRAAGLSSCQPASYDGQRLLPRSSAAALFIPTHGRFVQDPCGCVAASWRLLSTAKESSMPASDLGIRFVAGFGPIVRAPQTSRAFYVDMLGLALKPMDNDPDYFHGEDLEGVRHFALWPLANAAQSCFGSADWPASVPAPTSWLEFDVDDVGAASDVLKARGCRLLVENRQEPWGQTVTRLLSPEGILIGITFTPWLRG